MTRKLTDKEEQSVRRLENLAQQYDAVGEKEAAQSFQQKARNLRHILEHSYNIAYKVFNHRSDEAIHHMPYTALYMNGSEICVLNYEVSPIMTRQIRKKLGATPEEADVWPENTTVVKCNQNIKPIKRIRAKNGHVVAEVYAMDSSEEFAVHIPAADTPVSLRHSMMRKGMYTANSKGRMTTVFGVLPISFVLDSTNRNSTVEIIDGVTIRNIWESVHQH